MQTSFLVSLSAALTLTACQTYDFEPVTPVTISATRQVGTVEFRALPPTLMFVVDRSGSMGLRVPCSGSATCPTRLDEVKTAMGGFLASQPALARYGLVQYPFGTVGDDECASPPLASIGGEGSITLPNSDDPAVLSAAATQVKSTLESLDDWGNTPTSSVLTMLMDYVPLHGSERPNFVLLLTDGVPNCNANNVNSCANPAACRCTDNPCTGATCQLMCLDEDASVAAVAALREQGVRTIVVGFGASLSSGDGYAVLNAMAQAGGFGRRCQSNADCDTGDSCDEDAQQCRQTHFYQAQNAMDLGVALSSISEGIQTSGCRFQLQTAPLDPLFMTVRVDGELATRDATDGWELVEGDQVLFHGQLCANVSAGTSGAPHRIEISVVNPL